MSDNSYVKGNYDDIVKRFCQIHTINLRCPINSECISLLKTTMDTSFNVYADESGKYNNVPVADMYSAFMCTIGFCRNIGIDVGRLYIVIGCIQSFKNLKFVSLDFVDDSELDRIYDDIQKNNNIGEDKIKILNKIYDVKILEFNLSSMFSQYVIDLFNKHMMHNGLMSNSYLKREFYIDFDYDGYISYMDMFLGNNGILLNTMNQKIIDYFRLFPVFISEQKPVIRIITNYGEI